VGNINRNVSECITLQNKHCSWYMNRNNWRFQPFFPNSTSSCKFDQKSQYFTMPPYSTWNPWGTDLFHVESMWIPWNPHGIDMDSIWNLHGIHAESTWNRYGFHMESTWNPCRIHMDSFHMDSMWSPCRFHVDSTWNWGLIISEYRQKKKLYSFIYHWYM